MKITIGTVLGVVAIGALSFYLFGAAGEALVGLFGFATEAAEAAAVVL